SACVRRSPLRSFSGMVRIGFMAWVSSEDPSYRLRGVARRKAEGRSGSRSAGWCRGTRSGAEVLLQRRELLAPACAFLRQTSDLAFRALQALLQFDGDGSRGSRPIRGKVVAGLEALAELLQLGGRVEAVRDGGAAAALGRQVDHQAALGQRLQGG